MTTEEYAYRQRLITAAAAAFVLQFGSFLITPGMSTVLWLQFLQFIFPEVVARRRQSAELAREFYDFQRASFLPALARNDHFLIGSDFDQFVKLMEPVRQRVQRAQQIDLAFLDNSKTLEKLQVSVPRQSSPAITHAVLQVVRDVETAGRRQIIQAVREDAQLAEVLAQPDVVELDSVPVEPELVFSYSDEPQKPARVVDYKGREVKSRNQFVRGWARVATGAETCAWCLMLISRGPVYTAASGGLSQADESDVLQWFQGGDLSEYFEDIDEYMDEWHPGCDCKVVPVFKLDDWPGLDAQKRAEELWIDASNEARELVEKDPDRVYAAGQNKGEQRTFNDEVINALRRRLDRGDIKSSEYAALSVA